MLKENVEQEHAFSIDLVDISDIQEHLMSIYWRKISSFFELSGTCNDVDTNTY